MHCIPPVILYRTVTETMAVMIIYSWSLCLSVFTGRLIAYFYYYIPWCRQDNAKSDDRACFITHYWGVGNCKEVKHQRVWHTRPKYTTIRKWNGICIFIRTQSVSISESTISIQILCSNGDLCITCVLCETLSIDSSLRFTASLTASSSGVHIIHQNNL